MVQLAKTALLGIALILGASAGSVGGSMVVLGGAGPSPFFERAIDKIADALKADGVKVTILSSGSRARTDLLDEMKYQGYSNLLYFTVDRPRNGQSDPSRGDIVGACFVGGNKVWQEKSKGPLFLPHPVEQEVDSMADGLVKKIMKRIDGPCLPR